MLTGEMGKAGEVSAMRPAGLTDGLLLGVGDWGEPSGWAVTWRMAVAQAVLEG